jgi:predicted metal-dependent hydrolase
MGRDFRTYLLVMGQSITLLEKKRSERLKIRSISWKGELRIFVPHFLMKNTTSTFDKINYTFKNLFKVILIIKNL